MKKEPLSLVPPWWRKSEVKFFPANGTRLTFVVGWLVVLSFNNTLTAMVTSWRSVTHMCFLAFSHQYQNKIFFPKPPNTFLICFCWGERRKYAGKKVRFNRGSNSQPPGYESDTLTTVPSGQDTNLCGFGQLGVKLLEMSYLMQVTCSIGCVCGQAEIANVSEVRLTLHVVSGNNYF